MVATRPVTADKSVERFDLMNKSVLYQKFQRPIHRRWRGGAGFAPEFVQNFIGPDRGVAAPDDFQYLAAQWREAQPVLTTMLLGRVQRIGDTRSVIMLVRWKGRRRISVVI